MSFANRHNKNTSNLFTYQQQKDAQFIKCRDLYDQGYTMEAKKAATVRGVFISRAGKYGPSASLICEGFNVNLPAHMLEEVEEILRSPEDLEDINAGRVGVYAYEYVNKNGGASYSVTWTDLEELPY